ncbi:MAG: OmpA family protein [Chlorobi bacterium]|nr:OmpA family protein [Chlorobiota bacterium]MCI0715487.1 OmpA family protein [Chlorobiota bacterium]
MVKLITFSYVFLLTAQCFAQRDLETITSEEELKQFIYLTAPQEDAFVAVQRLAKPYIDKKNWEEAAKILLNYREWFIENVDRTDKIIDLLKSTLQNLEITSIETINTSKSEYFPVLTIDGLTMYFTFAEGKKGGEDIYYSQRIADTWIKPKNMGAPFSTKENDAVNSVSADGNVLVLFGSYKGFIGGGDNFYVERTSKGWSEIKPFPKPVNSIYWDCDGFLTADGKAFLFTSDRKGGVGPFVKGGQFYHGEYEGNTDIWVSVKNDSGWDNQINLGTVINTPFSERSPFLHPDGKTLYFSSDGHYGLGSLDVFKSVRLSDTSWTEWSEPVNLGKEINTSGFDVAYKITTDGEYAFFSSDREGGKGGYDIYSIKLPREAKPERNVVTIKGKVTDENMTPLDAGLKWYELSSNRNFGALTSNPETGEYIITLPNGSAYSYFAEKAGYYSVSNNVDLSGENSFKEMTVDIVMHSIKSLAELSIKLNNIYFDFDKYDLKPESFVELDRVFKFLTDNPDVNIEISAHTDSRGSDEYNLELSQKRAESVVSYLMSNGINPGRLIAKGYGESSPVASNETEEGMSANRRVEMKVLR